MFEYFGIKDIFSMIRKYKKSIISVLVLFCVVFGVSFEKRINGNMKGEVNISKLHSSSASYYVVPLKENSNNGELINADFYRAIPNNYVSILKSDVCTQYVYDRILEKYSKSDLIKNTMLFQQDPNMKEKDLNLSSFENIFEAEQAKNTMILNMVCETYDNKLSRDILDAYQDYLVNELEPTVKDAKLDLIGEVDQVINASDSIISETISKPSNVKLFIKYVILPIFLISALILICLFAIGMFNPTINRKSDFSRYSVPVIGEIKSIKKNRRKK